MNAAVDRLSVPPPKKMATLAIGGFATALGGGIAALCITWVGGIVTRAEMELELKPMRERAEAMQMAAKDASARDDKLAASLSELVGQLKSENIARRSDREMLVGEIRHRIGIQAAHAITADPKKRALGDRIAAAVRLNFDARVLRGEDPKIAADRALEAAQLQNR